MGQRQYWNEEEERLLAQLYPDLPTWQVAQRLKRTESQIYNKVNGMGLCKSDAFKNSPSSGRLRPGDSRGAATRFKKGHITWNKGKSYRAGGRSAETQFKPGYNAPNKAPIGAHRIADGYLQRKISDTGYPPRDWRGVHILLWEVCHGRPLPKGHALIFRDGDRSNIRISNLELLTRGELMRRNSIHRYPPELKHTIRVVAKLKRKIREVEDEKQD
jgi:hypothetical protein